MELTFPYEHIKKTSLTESELETGRKTLVQLRL